jgi:hypothetical protein
MIRMTIKFKKNRTGATIEGATRVQEPTEKDDHNRYGILPRPNRLSDADS